MEDRASEMKLRTRSGDNFDKDYMSEMVKDHEKDVKETEQLASSVKDPQLKSAIQSAHSKIQQHLAMAKQIAGAQGAAGGTSSQSGKSK
jgi:putative membrane protein